MRAIDELIEFMRSLSSSHLPDGWPAVRMQQITMLLDEIEAIRQERDGLRADAVRYRWLRKQHEKHLGLTICKVGMFDLTPWSGDDPDAAIDNAMAKEKGDGD